MPTASKPPPGPAWLAVYDMCESTALSPLRAVEYGLLGDRLRAGCSLPCTHDRRPRSHEPPRWQPGCPAAHRQTCPQSAPQRVVVVPVCLRYNTDRPAGRAARWHGYGLQHVWPRYRRSPRVTPNHSPPIGHQGVLNVQDAPAARPSPSITAIAGAVLLPIPPHGVPGRKFPPKHLDPDVVR